MRENGCDAKHDSCSRYRGEKSDDGVELHDMYQPLVTVDQTNRSILTVIPFINGGTGFWSSTNRTPMMLPIAARLIKPAMSSSVHVSATSLAYHPGRFALRSPDFFSSRWPEESLDSFSREAGSEITFSCCAGSETVLDIGEIGARPSSDEVSV